MLDVDIIVDVDTYIKGEVDVGIDVDV